MNKIFQRTLLLAGAMMTLVACSDQETINVKGNWNATEDYANVTFPTVSQVLELDPAEATTGSFWITRKNTQGSLTVPMKITENTDDVFEVSPVVFADGKDSAEVVLNFPKAEEGKTYTLTIQVDDPTMVSSYSPQTEFTMTVTRVKWVPVGKYKDPETGEIKDGMALFGEDFIASIYGTPTTPFVTKVEERADKPGYYRLCNTYEDWPGYASLYFNNDKDYYIYIDATDPNRVYIPQRCDIGVDIGWGDVIVYSLAGYWLENGDESQAQAYYGKMVDGIITFPRNSLLVGETDYDDGSLGEANKKGAFKLVLDPSSEKYETSILTDEDFTWAPLSSRLFKFESGLYKDMATAQVMVGTCVNTTDRCDSVFAEKFGTPYKIVGPYADGVDLYFCVKDGRIIIPNECYKQFIGIGAITEAVFAKINGGTFSRFSEQEISLNITFENYSGDITYGTYDELLTDYTYSTRVATGAYTYVALTQTGEREREEGYELFQRDGSDNVFMIEDFFQGGQLVFTWDQSTNDCTVLRSFTGWTHQSYGSIFAFDMPTIAPAEANYDVYPCYYDPEEQTFHFILAYGTYDQILAGPEEELFEVEWEENGVKGTVKTAKSRKAPKALKFAKSLWGKQMNRKSFKPMKWNANSVKFRHVGK